MLALIPPKQWRFRVPKKKNSGADYFNCRNDTANELMFNAAGLIPGSMSSNLPCDIKETQCQLTGARRDLSACLSLSLSFLFDCLSLSLSLYLVERDERALSRFLFVFGNPPSQHLLFCWDWN